MNHQNAFILGAGTFGSRAYSFLKSLYGPSGLTVVDVRPERLKKITAKGGRAVVMDAVSFLTSTQNKMGLDAWIVPAVPIHVAYEWVRHELESNAGFETRAVPEKIEAVLPNPMRGAAGQLYVSNADFVCPDDCPEPEIYCTATGAPRPRVLCRTLADLKLSGFRSICVVSSQLAPGVGGFQLRALRNALEAVWSHPGNILLSTACKCHGVIHAFRFDPGMSTA